MRGPRNTKKKTNYATFPTSDIDPDKWWLGDDDFISFPYVNYGQCSVVRLLLVFRGPLVNLCFYCIHPYAQPMGSTSILQLNMFLSAASC